MRFIAFLLAGTVLSTPVLAATIEVRPGQSIQDAVNRAQAGDEVVVDDGTYGAFEIRTNGISVRARNKGGAHVVATGNNQPAIAAYSQSDIAVRGFRLTSRNGDGVKIGGDASAPLAKNIVFEGNTTAYARLDGFKFFHADGITMRNNVVEMAGGGGAAGSAGNPNGDGGVDWVRVSNSLMEGNTVQRTNGWACAMIKNGSNNNRVVNNRFQNCEVNGIDMAAGSSGRSAAANTTGKTAFDNTIEGNVVEGGKGCAVKFGQKTSGNRLTDNDIDGRQCDKGTGNSGLAAGADDEVGAGGGGDGDYGGEEEYAGGGAEGGFLGTDYMGAGGGFSGGCDATIANGASAGAAAFGVISSLPVAPRRSSGGTAVPASGADPVRHRADGASGRAVEGTDADAAGHEHDYPRRRALDQPAPALDPDQRPSHRQPRHDQPRLPGGLSRAVPRGHHVSGDGGGERCVGPPHPRRAGRERAHRERRASRPAAHAAALGGAGAGRPRVGRHPRRDPGHQRPAERGSGIAG